MKYVAAFFHSYGAIVFGLAVGTIAHFGRLLADGKMPTWAQALGYVMQLGLIGLVAVNATRMMGLVDADTRALATAILAISTQEVVRYLKANAWQRYVPGATIEGEMRNAEQAARAAQYLLERDRVEEIIKRRLGK